MMAYLDVQPSSLTTSRSSPISPIRSIKNDKENANPSKLSISPIIFKHPSVDHLKQHQQQNSMKENKNAGSGGQETNFHASQSNHSSATLCGSSPRKESNLNGGITKNDIDFGNIGNNRMMRHHKDHSTDHVYNDHHEINMGHPMLIKTAIESATNKYPSQYLESELIPSRFSYPQPLAHQLKDQQSNMSNEKVIYTPLTNKYHQSSTSIPFHPWFSFYPHSPHLHYPHFYYYPPPPPPPSFVKNKNPSCHLYHKNSPHDTTVNNATTNSSSAPRKIHHSVNKSKSALKSELNPLKNDLSSKSRTKKSLLRFLKTPRYSVEPTIFQEFIKNGIRWCRYCGSTHDQSSFQEGPWGENTLCEQHANDFKGIVSKKFKLDFSVLFKNTTSNSASHSPSLDNANSAISPILITETTEKNSSQANISPSPVSLTENREQIDEGRISNEKSKSDEFYRIRPVLQEFCWRCFKKATPNGCAVIMCDGCPRSYHRKCFQGEPIPAALCSDKSLKWFCSDLCRRRNSEIVDKLSQKGNLLHDQNHAIKDLDSGQNMAEETDWLNVDFLSQFSKLPFMKRISSPYISSTSQLSVPMSTPVTKRPKSPCYSENEISTPPENNLVDIFSPISRKKSLNSSVVSLNTVISKTQSSKTVNKKNLIHAKDFAFQKQFKLRLKLTCSQSSFGNIHSFESHQKKDSNRLIKYPKQEILTPNFEFFDFEEMNDQQIDFHSKISMNEDLSDDAFLKR